MNILHAGAEHVTERQRSRLAAAVAADERHDEVWVAYHQASHAQGRAVACREDPRLVRLVPDPGDRRLGRTLTQWREAFLAYFTTGGANNGGTEAINGLIELHRRVARGFRNSEKYRLRKRCRTHYAANLMSVTEGAVGVGAGAVAQRP